jgi:hypothetical protein
MTDELMSDPTREVLGLDPVGSTGEEPEGNSLDSMTKAELIDEAEKRGVTVDDSATKADIKEALEG